MLSFLPIALVSVILITSQSPAAFAGFEDNDGDNVPAWTIPCTDENAASFNCDPDDNDPCNPDNSSEACLERFLELVEEVGEIMGEVDELVAEGELDINNGQLNAILTKLDTAADKILTENINAAIGALNAFINQINGHINAGHITPQDGQELIVAAQNIINTLE